MPRPAAHLRHRSKKFERSSSFCRRAACRYNSAQSTSLPAAATGALVPRPVVDGAHSLSAPVAAPEAVDLRLHRQTECCCQPVVSQSNSCCQPRLRNSKLADLLRVCTIVDLKFNQSGQPLKIKGREPGCRQRLDTVQPHCTSLQREPGTMGKVSSPPSSPHITCLGS
jgi:hypothetical protein